MAETLPIIPLPPNTWVDIYDATGIAVGEQIIAQNIGPVDANLVTSPTEPLDLSARNILARTDYARNEINSTGEWAFCQNDGGCISVKKAFP